MTEPNDRCCPECGRLFIEAGVIVRAPTSTTRARLRIVLIVTAGLTLCAALGTTMLWMSARAAQARAIAARQAALAQTQAAAAALATQPASSAPAAGADSDEPDAGGP